MQSIFPEPIQKLPQAEVPFPFCTAFLSQSDTHQVIFNYFDEDADLEEHAHESMWSVVLEGKIDIVTGGVTHTYTKGDRFLIEKGVPHAGKIYAGYADITFFNQKERYRVKT